MRSLEEQCQDLKEARKNDEESYTYKVEMFLSKYNSSSENISLDSVIRLYTEYLEYLISKNIFCIEELENQLSAFEQKNIQGLQLETCLDFSETLLKIARAIESNPLIVATTKYIKILLKEKSNRYYSRANYLMQLAHIIHAAYFLDFILEEEIKEFELAFPYCEKNIHTTKSFFEYFDKKILPRIRLEEKVLLIEDSVNLSAVFTNIGFYTQDKYYIQFYKAVHSLLKKTLEPFANSILNDWKLLANSSKNDPEVYEKFLKLHAEDFDILLFVKENEFYETILKIKYNILNDLLVIYRLNFLNESKNAAKLFDTASKVATLPATKNWHYFKKGQANQLLFSGFRHAKQFDSAKKSIDSALQDYTNAIIGIGDDSIRRTAEVHFVEVLGEYIYCYSKFNDRCSVFNTGEDFDNEIYHEIQAEHNKNKKNAEENKKSALNSAINLLRTLIEHSLSFEDLLNAKTLLGFKIKKIMDKLEKLPYLKEKINNQCYVLFEHINSMIILTVHEDISQQDRVDGLKTAINACLGGKVKQDLWVLQLLEALMQYDTKNLKAYGTQGLQHLMNSYKAKNTLLRKRDSFISPSKDMVITQFRMLVEPPNLMLSLNLLEKELQLMNNDYYFYHTYWYSKILLETIKLGGLNSNLSELNINIKSTIITTVLQALHGLVTERKQHLNNSDIIIAINYCKEFIHIYMASDSLIQASCITMAGSIFLEINRLCLGSDRKQEALEYLVKGLSVFCDDKILKAKFFEQFDSELTILVKAIETHLVIPSNKINTNLEEYKENAEKFQILPSEVMQFHEEWTLAHNGLIKIKEEVDALVIKFKKFRENFTGLQEIIPYIELPFMEINQISYSDLYSSYNKLSKIAQRIIQNHINALNICVKIEEKIDASIEKVKQDQEQRVRELKITCEKAEKKVENIKTRIKQLHKSQNTWKEEEEKAQAMLIEVPRCLVESLREDFSNKKSQEETIKKGLESARKEEKKAHGQSYYYQMHEKALTKSIEYHHAVSISKEKAIALKVHKANVEVRNVEKKIATQEFLEAKEKVHPLLEQEKTLDTKYYSYKSIEDRERSKLKPLKRKENRIEEKKEKIERDLVVLEEKIRALENEHQAQVLFSGTGITVNKEGRDFLVQMDKEITQKFNTNLKWKGSFLRKMLFLYHHRKEPEHQVISEAAIRNYPVNDLDLVIDLREQEASLAKSNAENIVKHYGFQVIKSNEQFIATQKTEPGYSIDLIIILSKKYGTSPPIFSSMLCEASLTENEEGDVFEVHPGLRFGLKIPADRGESIRETSVFKKYQVEEYTLRHRDYCRIVAFDEAKAKAVNPTIDFTELHLIFVHITAVFKSALSSEENKQRIIPYMEMLEFILRPVPKEVIPYMRPFVVCFYQALFEADSKYKEFAKESSELAKKCASEFIDTLVNNSKFLLKKEETNSEVIIKARGTSSSMIKNIAESVYIERKSQGNWAKQMKTLNQAPFSQTGRGDAGKVNPSKAVTSSSKPGEGSLPARGRGVSRNPVSISPGNNPSSFHNNGRGRGRGQQRQYVENPRRNGLN